MIDVQIHFHVSLWITLRKTSAEGMKRRENSIYYRVECGSKKHWHKSRCEITINFHLDFAFSSLELLKDCHRSEKRFSFWYQKTSVSVLLAFVFSLRLFFFPFSRRSLLPVTKNKKRQNVIVEFREYKNDVEWFLRDYGEKKMFKKCGKCKILIVFLALSFILFAQLIFLSWFSFLVPFAKSQSDFHVPEIFYFPNWSCILITYIFGLFKARSQLIFHWKVFSLAIMNTKSGAYWHENLSFYQFKSLEQGRDGN